jgi:hypothetical protein
VLIRLDPKVEDPSTRTGFRHTDLETWAVAHRGRLLWSALVFGQAWIAAGRPMATAAFGGFTEWASVLGGAMEIAGISGFLLNRRTLFDQADEESAHVRAFLADWWKEHEDAPVLVKALIELAKGHPLPIASRSEQGTLIRLGQLVKSLGSPVSLQSLTSLRPSIRTYARRPPRRREKHAAPGKTHQTHRLTSSKSCAYDRRPGADRSASRPRRHP